MYLYYPNSIQLCLNWEKPTVQLKVAVFFIWSPATTFWIRRSANETKLHMSKNFTITSSHRLITSVRSCVYSPQTTCWLLYSNLAMSKRATAHVKGVWLCVFKLRSILTPFSTHQKPQFSLFFPLVLSVMSSVQSAFLLQHWMNKVASSPMFSFTPPIHHTLS